MSMGPRSPMAATVVAMTSTLSMRALISTLRAMSVSVSTAVVVGRSAGRGRRGPREGAPPAAARESGDGHRVARRARGAGEAQRVERPRKLVDLVPHEALEIQVLVDV